MEEMIMIVMLNIFPMLKNRKKSICKSLHFQLLIRHRRRSSKCDDIRQDQAHRITLSNCKISRASIQNDFI